MQYRLHTNTAYLSARQYMSGTLPTKDLPNGLLVVIVTEGAEEFGLWLGQELVQHRAVPQRSTVNFANSAS